MLCFQLRTRGSYGPSGRRNSLASGAGARSDGSWPLIPLMWPTNFEDVASATLKRRSINSVFDAATIMVAMPPGPAVSSSPWGAKRERKKKKGGLILNPKARHDRRDENELAVVIILKHVFRTHVLIDIIQLIELRSFRQNE